MERDFENRHRQQSRIVINDYPSSHLPQPQRPKFWGDTTEPARRQPQRALSYVERPCTPRETTALQGRSQDQALLSTTQPQPSGGDNKCRHDADSSGLSPAHCSPCYISSALYAGHKPSGDRAQMPDTAAEVMQLSSVVERQLERVALSGCGSITKPKTTTKPVCLI